MNTPTRVQRLEAIAAELAQLLTPKEAQTYPIRDHLADLIADLQLEAP